MLSPPFALLIGACVGSFLNVCLFRWKHGGQIVAPSSYCPHCKKAIHWYDNIPIVSFVLLKGRCRFCRIKISWQYPVVEALTAVLFWICPMGDPSGLYLRLSHLTFLSFLILLAVSDLKWRVLPHSFNNLFILAGLVFSGSTSFFSLARLFESVWGFVILGSAPFLLSYYFPKGLGGGDIKMLASLAIWDGVTNTFLILICANLIALGIFLCLVITKRVAWNWKIPFGSFLALSALITLVKPDLLTPLRNLL